MTTLTLRARLSDSWPSHYPSFRLNLPQISLLLLHGLLAASGNAHDSLEGREILA